jgi:ribosome-binding factor A
MKFKRTDRVSDLIQKEISDILLKEISDPRIGFVTITEVRLADDLRDARVFASVLGSPSPEHERRKRETLEGLRSATPFIQRELGRRIQLRVTPRLLFSLDDSSERGAKMDELIREAREQDEEKTKKRSEAGSE